jgi:putative SOS response-associated peptidase YedK
MCGRYTLVASIDELIQEFELTNVPEFSPGSNISPTEACLVVHANGANCREAQLMHWGFPSHAGKPLINARAETAHKKQPFSQAFQNRRCLVPARGFYEWRSEQGKKRPYCFSRPDGRLMAFAGLWQPFEGEAGKPLHAFTILTTTASKPVASYHDRMPAIISPDQYAQWLDPQMDNYHLSCLLGASNNELAVCPCDPSAVRQGSPAGPSQPTLFDLNSSEDGP